MQRLHLKTAVDAFPRSFNFENFFLSCANRNAAFRRNIWVCNVDTLYSIRQCLFSCMHSEIANEMKKPRRWKGPAQWFTLPLICFKSVHNNRLCSAEIPRIYRNFDEKQRSRNASMKMSFSFRFNWSTLYASIAANINFHWNWIFSYHLS